MALQLGAEPWLAAARAKYVSLQATTSDPHKMFAAVAKSLGSSPEIEALQAKIAAELGYEIVRHRLELYGRKIPAPGKRRGLR